MRSRFVAVRGIWMALWTDGCSADTNLVRSLPLVLFLLILPLHEGVFDARER